MQQLQKSKLITLVNKGSNRYANCSTYRIRGD
jgi:hypothetical protein